nr:hypothetical protein [Tanacetum cinerariifolium]
MDQNIDFSGFDQIQIPHTILETESDEVIKSSVKKLVPIPREYEVTSEDKKEVDLFLASDNSIPPGIESDDYDSEGDSHFLKELHTNDSILIPENESSNYDHHDDPSFPRPPSEPPDVEFFFDLEPTSGEVISAMMNNIDELNEDECFNPGGVKTPFLTLASPFRAGGISSG